ncbi:MAG: hypothetical protein MI867_19910 [Pseudomonadales bacterium]|nr:hypothetical protein [Pseudomonadales bacterium]
MKSALKLISLLLVLYVLHAIYQSPLSDAPTPFWDLSSGDNVSDGKLGTFLLLGGLVALLLCGSMIYGVVKLCFGMIQHAVESMIPRQYRMVAPLVALCCLLYPLNTFKSEVKYLSVSTVMQVDMVLNMSDEYSIHVKQVDKNADA